MKLTILIGISGSGKSTYAKTIPDAYVVSSDAIRSEFGDINDMSRNNDVFDECHRRIIVGIQAGKHVVYDATNVSALMLTDFLRWFRYRCPTVPITAKVFDIPPAVAIRRIRADIANGVHRSNVPNNIVYKQSERLANLLNTRSEFEAVFDVTFELMEQQHENNR